jgi:hypothetical protein
LKKTFIPLIAAILIGAVIFGSGRALAADVTAKPSKQSFYLDGEAVEIAAYAINGNNYVKLRDVCKLVDYKITYETISTGEFVIYARTTSAYRSDSDTNDGVKPAADTSAKPSDVYALFNSTGSDFLESGLVNIKRTYPLTAYKINGNNYIQLRSFAESVSKAGVTAADKAFDVRYDPKDNSVHILTKTVYTGKDLGDNSPVATPAPSPTSVSGAGATPALIVIYKAVPTLGERPARIYSPGTWTFDLETPVEMDMSFLKAYNGEEYLTTLPKNNYLYYNVGLYGVDCVWYAYSRFQEINGFKPGWEYKEKPTDNWKTVTDLSQIQSLSLAVYYKDDTFAHVLFIEYVERDANGNPANIYFTESGANLIAAREDPGCVRKLTFAEFKQRGDQTLVCYVVKK